MADDARARQEALLGVLGVDASLGGGTRRQILRRIASELRPNCVRKCVRIAPELRACLEGVARQRELVLRERERLAGGDAELPLDEVDAGHHLGHRVLDLQDEEGGAGSE